MTHAVIFDLDGTLIDSLPDVLGALNPVLAEAGRRKVTVEEGRLMVGGGAEPLIERAFGLRRCRCAIPRSSTGSCLHLKTWRHVATGLEFAPTNRMIRR